MTIQVTEAGEKDRARFYHGRSMLGTFCPGDYLILEEVPVGDVQPGDVVVFDGVNPDGDPDQIVHRVIAVLPEGLVTRGDNNPWVDIGLVTADVLLGRVTHVKRGSRTRPVHGGRWGLLGVRLFRVRRRLQWRSRQFIAFLGGGLYRSLRESGLVSRLWQPSITKVNLTTDDGPVVKYVCGGRTVAWWWPETGRFRCRKPYDLIISRPEKV